MLVAVTNLHEGRFLSKWVEGAEVGWFIGHAQQCFLGGGSDSRERSLKPFLSYRQTGTWKDAENI